MSSITNNNEAAYWFALVNQSGVSLPKLKPMMQKWHLIEGQSIIQLFSLSATELSMRFGLSEDEARRVLKTAETHQAHLRMVEQWAGEGIQLVTLNHPHYPSRLIFNLPPQQQPLLLWVKGNTEKLLAPTLTILGQTDPAPEVLNFVQDLAPVLVAEGIGVVSGYGKGLDRHVFETILEMAHGYALAVLPMGLSALAKLTTRLNPAIEAGQATLVSPFAPEADYKESFAEARNLLVDSLALALVVPAVDQDLLLRSQAALDRGMPVLVSLTDSPQNRTLIDHGAFLLTDIGEVIELVQQVLIDDTSQAQLAQVAPTLSPPALAQDSRLLKDDHDDYAIRSAEVEPIDPDEALDILASMGTVPDSLRARLRAIEQTRPEQKDQA